MSVNKDIIIALDEGTTNAKAVANGGHCARNHLQRRGKEKLR